MVAKTNGCKDKWLQRQMVAKTNGCKGKWLQRQIVKNTEIIITLVLISDFY
jgi:hypothetical protein